MDLSDPKTWTDGSAVVGSAPHIVAPLVIAVAGAVWWARGRFDKSKIDGLEERLNLAKDHHGYLLKTSDDVAKKLADAQAEIAKLKHQIEDRAAPEVLRGTIGSAEKYIADTATANNDLRRAIAGTITRVKVPR